MLTDIIFDLDGTLIDSAAGILSALAAALASRGIEPTVDLSPALVGPPLTTTLSRILGSEDPDLLAPLIEAFKARYDSEGCKSVSVFPGVEEMLARLGAAEIKLHIATNKRRTPTLAILENLGWTGRFDSVFCSDMYARAFATKADMLHTQLRERSLAISSTAYVGDRMEDGHAAGANGLLFYLAAWGYDVVASPQVLPSWVRAGSPSEVP